MGTDAHLKLNSYLSTNAGHESIAAWNDDPDRTAAEVAEAMRQAAKSTRTYTETTNGGRL